MRRTVFGLFLAVLVGNSAFAESDRAVLLVHPLENSGHTNSETAFIESLLWNYLASMSGIELRRPEEPDTADYEMSGGFSSDGTVTTVTLNVKNLSTGEVVSYNSTYRDNAEVALRLHSIAQSIFREQISGSGQNALLAGESLTLNNILGLWHGANGIEMINFMRDGSAVAFFSSGERMTLRFTIENNVLKLIQQSPNRERYYEGQDARAAAELAQKAQPLYFELALTGSGLTLRGKRVETYAEVDAQGAVRLVHNVESEIEWKRSTR